MATKKEGLKANGTLKKGYKYAKGGKIVKVKSPGTATRKKKAVRKKRRSRT